jgi:hypothetical protein
MKPLLAGFLYGCLFLPLFFVIGGAGHGLFFLIYAVAAPLSLVPIGIIAFPLFASAASWCATNRPKTLFIPLITIHYVSAIIIGWTTYREERNDTFFAFDQKLTYDEGWLVSLCLLYAIGQCLLWISFSKALGAKAHAYDPA